MELSQRALTAVLCLLGVILVGAFGLAALRHGGTVKPPLELAQQGAETRLQPRTLSHETADAIALRSMELTRAKEQIDRLQNQIHEQSRQLSDIQYQLDDAERANRRLQTEQEQALAWLISVGSGQAASTASAADAVPNDLMAAELAEWQRLLEMEDLRAQLAEVRGELEALRTEYNLTQDRLTQTLNVDAAASRTVAAIGGAAIPFLIEALEHPQPEVRRWAARSLREMGVNGQAALPALTLALADPEDSVRAEVARALQAIRD
jgi:regulator of replication initiation timing